jgi:hypothetical protein
MVKATPLRKSRREIWVIATSRLLSLPVAIDFHNGPRLASLMA